MCTPVAGIKTPLANSVSSATSGSTTRRIGQTIAVGTYRTLNWCQSTAIPATTAAVLPILAFAFGVSATKLSSLRIA